MNLFLKLRILFLLIFFSGLFGLAKSSKAATINAASCSYSDVSTAISSASIGDTVIIPAGSCAWATGLSITKGIYLMGAGIDATKITWAGGAGGFVLQYIPSSPSLDTPFRLSGLTFDMNDTVTGDYPEFYFDVNSNIVTRQTKIRIDHNKFKNSMRATIFIHGMYGVIDSNIFENSNRPISSPGGGSGENLWNSFLDFNYGSVNNIYIEDNIMTGVIRNAGGADYIQGGNRMAWRYNTINVSAAFDAYWLFEHHGNMGPGSYWSAMGQEIYGNQINDTANGSILGARGGKSIVFYNNVTSASGSWSAGTVKEELRDSANPVTSVGIQHVNDTYFWLNRKNGSNFISGVSLQSGQDCATLSSCSGTCTYSVDCQYNGAGQPSIIENVQFWQEQSSKFNGSAGVGCGTLSQMNAITSCTQGVGFWATNQSCSDVTGLVGDIITYPARSTITGTFYKCGANNNWVSHFTPFTYPHPIRTECIIYPGLCDAISDTTPPAAPTGLNVN